jgi:hypothetical protein
VINDVAPGFADTLLVSLLSLLIVEMGRLSYRVGRSAWVAKPIRAQPSYGRWAADSVLFVSEHSLACLHIGSGTDGQARRRMA